MVNDTILPRALQYFGGHPGCGAVGVGAEIAGAVMDMQLTVRGQAYQPVITAAPGRVKRLAHADTDDFRSLPLPATRAFFFPIKGFGTLLQRITLIRARNRALVTVVFTVVVRRVNAPDRDLVESEFASGLVQDGFNRRSDLILAGTTLRSSRRRVRLNRDPPITHRERLIENRDRTRRRAEIAPARVRAVLLNDRQIDGSDTAVIPESHSQPPLEPGSRRT